MYPSLPEPYINLYFALDQSSGARIKGISSTTDKLVVKSQLFGVRLFLKGYYQLNLASARHISNQLLSLESIADSRENQLAKGIATAMGFEERISLFRSYFQEKTSYQLSLQEKQTAAAFQYLVDHYKSPQVIKEYAAHIGVTERSISRWFQEGIGIAPKNLARIARFNAALYHLHAYEEPGFYYDFGYFDQAHFIKEFKQLTGFTPKAYLKFTSDLYN